MRASLTAARSSSAELKSGSSTVGQPQLDQRVGVRAGQHGHALLLREMPAPAR